MALPGSDSALDRIGHRRSARRPRPERLRAGRSGCPRSPTSPTGRKTVAPNVASVSSWPPIDAGFHHRRSPGPDRPPRRCWRGPSRAPTAAEDRSRRPGPGPRGLRRIAAPVPKSDRPTILRGDLYHYFAVIYCPRAFTRFSTSPQRSELSKYLFVSQPFCLNPKWVKTFFRPAAKTESFEQQMIANERLTSKADCGKAANMLTCG